MSQLAETCFVCGEPATGECERCQTSVYCSAQCQALDWCTGHSVECARFIGANGDSAEERRRQRRQSVRRRRAVRPEVTGVPRRADDSDGAPRRRRRRVTVRTDDGRTYEIAAALQPGEYEVYDVEVRTQRSTVRDGFTRNFAITTTLVQTRDEFDRDTRTLTVFKPLLPPAGALYIDEHVAAVEINCPAAFPRGTSCWRSVEVIALPSVGERGEASIERTDSLARPSRRRPRGNPSGRDGDGVDGDEPPSTAGPTAGGGGRGIVITLPDGVTIGGSVRAQMLELQTEALRGV